MRRRLSEGAPPRGAHAGDGFIVGGSCARADGRLGSALLVAKSGGKEVSHIEKNSDVVAEVLREQPRARRAEGLGRTTKQLGCVIYDGVVDLDLARLVRAGIAL